MAKPNGLKPGQTTPVSGQYQTVGPRGGKGAEVTGVQGKRLPPTQAVGSTYKLVDATKHKSSK
jgi:hypothetical protein